MAPLPDNNTAVYFVDYQFQGRRHTLQMRVVPPATAASAATVAQAFLNNLLSLMDSTWSIEGARFRAAGSAVTLPATAPVLSGAGTAGNLPPRDHPKFHTFVGRGAVDGRRVRVFLYGLNIVVDGDYRLNGPLTGALADARNSLVGNTGTGHWRTIGGSEPTWYNYVNQGYNSYWEREQRG